MIHQIKISKEANNCLLRMSAKPEIMKQESVELPNEEFLIPIRSHNLFYIKGVMDAKGFETYSEAIIFLYKIRMEEFVNNAGK